MAVTDNDILRVVQTMTWDDGNIIQNVYNCKITGGGGPYDDQDVADDMAEWMDEIYDGLAGVLSSELNVGEAVTYLYDAVGDDWDEVAGAVPTFAPIAIGQYLAQGVAAMVRANSTDPDVQARKFFGGLTEDSSIDGGWSVSVLASLVAAGLDWITPFVGTETGATITPGVWSPTQSLFFAFVEHLIVNAIANYQRRRRPGVGV